MIKVYKILWSILICARISEQSKNIENSHPIERFCSSFITCNDCKKASLQCDWCHEKGCTHYSNIHNPQKAYKNYTRNEERFCNGIISDEPIFIAADSKRFIKMNIRIDDFTIYKRNILCEIHIEEKILHVNATINENVLFCDMTVLRITRSARLGYIRLYWGGAEPYSNMILIIVYKCEYMASNCLDCQVLDKRFKCGWCVETSLCSLSQECSRRREEVEESWINKTSLCEINKKRINHYAENIKQTTSA